jgi:hypothetical protein
MAFSGGGFGGFGSSNTNNTTNTFGGFGANNNNTTGMLLPYPTLRLYTFAGTVLLSISTHL